tara:strand:+ start:12583 stop:13491 length:909 start_codon:yes stop_codon:yes gene_type:complete
MKIENMFYIHEKEWHELQAWAGLAYEEDKDEISGLMTAVPDKDGRFKLSDVEILKQENTGVTTELDAESVAEYKMKYAMKYKNKDMKYVWWHSHHTMGAFWSGTDETEIDAWKNSSFSLALVVNLREEYKFRVSIWSANGIPLEQHIDTTLEVVRGAKPVITDKMKTLYKELCEKKMTSIKTYTGYNRSHGIQQTSFLNKSPNEANLPEYRQMFREIDSLIEDFMSSESSFGAFKKSMKKLRTKCVKEKYDFKVKAILCSKDQAINDLQCYTAEDMFDFDDNDKKMLYESDNDVWGYGGWLS